MPFTHRLLLLMLAAPLAAAAAQGLPRARPEDAGMSSDALARIGPALQRYVDSNRVAGIAMAVIRHGKVVYFDAIGTMDSSRTVPMRPDAVFRLYSMTKPVTTVAIMQLSERGRLKLTDPVSKYIPAFANTQIFTGGSAAQPATRPLDTPITIAQLLTHTSGLTYGAFGNSAVDTIYQRARILGANQPIAFIADSLAKLPLLFAPGTKWNYSMALDVLGRVVEVVSGETFDAYLQKEIFAPLSMDHSGFHATPAMNGNITWIFAPSASGPRPAARLLDVSYTGDGKAFMGGQGLLSTIPDYMRFTQMLLNGGELDGKRVLAKSSVELMMQNELPAGVMVSRGTGFGYGGSVEVDSNPSSPTPVGTFQWAGYASTYFWIDPKNDLIGMVWAQLSPQTNVFEAMFKTLVYGAVSAR